MRLFISGSAPLLEETHNQFENITGHKILERYGMTETNMNASNPLKGERKAGSVGKALKGTSIRITSIGENNLSEINEPGMIEIKGPNVFTGYLNKPEKTKEAFTDDEYFITGDMGYFDKEGYLFITGRNKDLIISGGYNLYPKEIEDIINQFDGIIESAVFGLSDDDLGEIPTAAIVANENNFNLDDLKKFIQENLARYKVPKKYFLISELPRNVMGKVQKNILKDQYS
jgi:malonyl-CoA/methylmalonyl-CoA synthetase